MEIPKGWHIERNPKPIPTLAHDWDYWHDEVDNDSTLCGTASSKENALLAVIEKEIERSGMSKYIDNKYADEPDDEYQLITTEALQEIIADMQRDIVARDNRITELEAAQQWVPASERLPDEMQWIFWRNPLVHSSDLGRVWYERYRVAEKLGTACEWMPAPPTRKERGNE